jgi:hypothetical protein
LTQGTIIYEHAGFAGQSALLTGDADNLTAYKGPCEHYTSSGDPYSGTYTYDWNDCISSIRVRRQ